MACRAAKPQRELVRLVRRPDRTVQLDPMGRLAGRGAYVCRDDACITNAIGRGLIGRALDAPIPASLASELLAAAAPTTISGGPRGQE